MELDDRMLFLLLGGIIGFVAGYFVRLVQDVRTVKEDVDYIRGELDEVDEIVKKELGHHEEGGFVKSSFTTIAVALVVGLAVFAAFASQKASNDVKESVERTDIVTYCNLRVTADALNALNERSTYTISQTQANVDLQTDFSKFFNLLLHQPPYNEEKRQEAARDYQTSLNNFVDVAGKTKIQVEENPFPTEEDLLDCIENGETEREQ